MIKPADKKPLWPVLKRGWKGYCPNCGKGPLFLRYLKPVSACSSCGEAIGHIRADDGPAWLTILMVGHLVVPFFYIILPYLDWPDWMVILSIAAAAIALSMLILPRAKGMFIGIIWRLKCVGSEV